MLEIYKRTATMSQAQLPKNKFLKTGIQATIALAAIVSIVIGPERKAMALSITTTYASDNGGGGAVVVYFLTLMYPIPMVFDLPR